MSGRSAAFIISGNSPAGAAQAVVGKPIGGLESYDRFTVHAELIGAVGGTLDVYLQREMGDGEWADWIHFPQLLAGAAAVKYAAADCPTTATCVAVGETDAAGTAGAPALAANTVAPGHPGSRVRCLAVAGGGAAAAAVKITVRGSRTDV